MIVHSHEGCGQCTLTSHCMFNIQSIHCLRICASGSHQHWHYPLGQPTLGIAVSQQTNNIQYQMYTLATKVTRAVPSIHLEIRVNLFLTSFYNFDLCYTYFVKFHCPLVHRLSTDGASSKSSEVPVAVQSCGKARAQRRARAGLVSRRTSACLGPNQRNQLFLFIFLQVVIVVEP